MTVIMSVYLFMFEFKNYFIIKTRSELLIDNTKDSEKLMINVDITMHRIPCYILSMDISDFTGAHTSNVAGTLVKKSLDKDGNVLSVYSKNLGDSHEDHGVKEFKVEDVERAFNNSEGCRLSGSFEVMRLPGNFHIASHTFAPIIREFRAKGKEINLDLTHTIHHISFENEKDLKIIKEKFNEGIMTPMDGFKLVDDTKGTLLNYYINIIPSSYQDIDGSVYNAFQFTFKQKKVDSGRMIPTIFFRYDISPILMKYTKYYPGHFDGVINICAIFGGMFTIAGILDSMLLKLFKKNSEVKAEI